MNANKVVLKFVKLGITTIIALLVIYGTVSVSLVGFDFGYRVFTEPAMEEEPGRDVSVIIDPGMSKDAIGRELESRGLIRNATLFVIQLELSAYADRIQPGTYILNTSMAPKDIMVALSVEPEEETEEETEE